LINVIGIGKAGCAIADIFANYPQYNIYKIDVGLEGKNCLSVKKQKGPEEYENNYEGSNNLFDTLEGMSYIVLGGSGDISAICLRLMEEIKDKTKITVIYISPDKTLLSANKKMHEKVTYNVLQEYARSGAIERVYLVSNTEVETVIGDVPIIGYYEKLNNVIVSTLHMINVCSNQTPVMGALEEPGLTRRISTFGLYDISEDKEKLFFSLDSPRESCYIYCVGEKRLRADGTLHKTIITQMKGKIKDEIQEISYGVFSTNYEENYGYVTVHSPMIQN